MKFITSYPFNNITVFKNGYKEEYIPFKSEHTVKLLFLKENKAPEDKGTKNLVCPFCGEVLTIKKYTVYSHYEDIRDENEYYYEPTVDHTCDALDKIEEKINEIKIFEKQIDNIMVEINLRKNEIDKINKEIKQLAINNTTVKIFNKTIFKKN